MLSQTILSAHDIKQIGPKDIKRLVTRLRKIISTKTCTVYRGSLKLDLVVNDGLIIKKGTIVAVKTQVYTPNTRLAELDNLKRLAQLEGVNKLYAAYWCADIRTLYYVLEYLDAGDLFSALIKPKLFRKRPAIDMIKICNDLQSTLRTMHACGVVHRDIKAENIGYDTRLSRAVFIDFGASLADGEMDLRGHGTLNTMAPEVLAGNGYIMTIDDWKKADMYSLGCTLYELTMGHQYPPQSIFTKHYRGRGGAGGTKPSVAFRSNSRVCTLLAFDPNERTYFDL